MELSGVLRCPLDGVSDTAAEIIAELISAKLILIAVDRWVILTAAGLAELSSLLGEPSSRP